LVGSGPEVKRAVERQHIIARQPRGTENQVPGTFLARFGIRYCAPNSFGFMVLCLNNCTPLEVFSPSTPIMEPSAPKGAGMGQGLWPG